MEKLENDIRTKSSSSTQMMSYVESTAGHNAIVNEFIVDEMHLTDISNWSLNWWTSFIVCSLFFLFRYWLMNRWS